MAAGTFTCNALGMKNLKKRIKTQRKIVSHSNSTRAMPISVGTTVIKPYLSICLVGLVQPPSVFLRWTGGTLGRQPVSSLTQHLTDGHNY